MYENVFRSLKFLEATTSEQIRLLTMILFHRPFSTFILFVALTKNSRYFFLKMQHFIFARSLILDLINIVNTFTI